MPSETPSSFSSREKMLLGLSIGLGLGLLAVIILLIVQTQRPVVQSGSLVIAPPQPQSPNAFPPLPPMVPVLPPPPIVASSTDQMNHGGSFSNATSSLHFISLEQHQAELDRQRASASTTQIILPVQWQAPKRVSRRVLGTTLDGQPLPDQLSGPYLRGVISGGPAKGVNIYTIGTPCDGMGCPAATSTSVVAVASTPTSTRAVTFLGDGGINALSDPSGIAALGLPTQDPSGSQLNYVLAQGSPPQTLHLQNGSLLTMENTVDIPFDYPGMFFESGQNCTKNNCPDMNPITMTQEGWTVFDPSHGQSDIKVVIGNNGLSYLFVSALAFDRFDADNNRPVITGATLSFDAPYTNNAAYVRYYLGGCGGVDAKNVSSQQDEPSSKLIPIGHAKDGSTLYGVKDYASDPASKRAYDDWYVLDANGDKPSYEEFLQRYPVPFFMWKDAFGENVRYVLHASVAPVECGKPVIYLYPEQKTAVHVALPSFIRVTESDPAYPKHGWDVVADPKGQLEYQGKHYSSLFWEGEGASYMRPTTGFVLKDGEVDQRLRSILAREGLNAQESKNFRDFWVPRMTGAPYYRVSFVTTQDWNRAVPLNVRPHPTSAIRVFMDWEKLAQPITIDEPQIVTPLRHGFTLVEWGGLLRK